LSSLAARSAEPALLVQSIYKLAPHGSKADVEYQTWQPHCNVKILEGRLGLLMSSQARKHEAFISAANNAI
jgi:hypothetical protein